MPSEPLLALLLPSPLYESLLDVGSGRVVKMETPFGTHPLTFGAVDGVPIVVAQQFGGDPPLSSAAFNMQSEAGGYDLIDLPSFLRHPIVFFNSIQFIANVEKSRNRCRRIIWVKICDDF